MAIPIEPIGGNPRPAALLAAVAACGDGEAAGPPLGPTDGGGLSLVCAETSTTRETTRAETGARVGAALVAEEPGRLS